jgi:hypothetical protein
MGEGDLRGGDGPVTANKIVPGGERVGKSPAGGPALRVSVDRPPSVLRRSGRRPAEFFHAIDWGFVGFCFAVAATVYVVISFALERAA